MHIFIVYLVGLNDDELINQTLFSIHNQLFVGAMQVLMIMSLNSHFVIEDQQNIVCQPFLPLNPTSSHFLSVCAVVFLFYGRKKTYFTKQTWSFFYSLLFLSFQTNLHFLFIFQRIQTKIVSPAVLCPYLLFKKNDSFWDPL